MAELKNLIETELQKAFNKVLPGSEPVLRRSNVADFQANGVFSVAKNLGKNPYDVAVNIASKVSISHLGEIEVDPKGFINIYLKNEFLQQLANNMINSSDLGIEKQPRKRIVVDYSSPNVAKEMHVGHLRSTLIGDALVRMLSFCGHEVIRENHIGDWGTPFGMLIQYLKEKGVTHANTLEVGDLDAFYKAARKRFDEDLEFQRQAKENVVLLQQADPQTLSLWNKLVEQSTRYFQRVYEKLGVLLTEKDIKGESFYKELIPIVINDLKEKSLLVNDQGSQCVFVEGYFNKEGNRLPLIIVKSDGGYSYGATDLAAIYDRIFNLNAQEILYVVGLPQSDHLGMCFKVAEMANWTKEVRLIHVGFGSVLGPDKKMLRTRAGEPIKLSELIEQAIEAAKKEVKKRYGENFPQDLTPEMVAIGAIKYADLSTERTRDYVYNEEKMISFEGNTGPYLQYAHARIASVLRKAQGFEHGQIKSSLNNFERDLVIELLCFQDSLYSSIATYEPHKLCNYLYELASKFSRFYENCPILKAEQPYQESRLALSLLTKKVLKKGLELIGIQAPEKM